VKPEFQKQYSEQLSQVGTQSQIRNQARVNQLNLTASKQMISQLKLQEAQELAETPFDET
jgi:hypothetical protein